ncbi:MAG: PilW family protein [Candidatus Nanoarchaeia archaeon]
MKTRLLDKKGITLIELMIALVIAGILIGGVYKLFISQSKSYAVQEQVADTQQNIRGAMEILLRDLRMAGYDDYKTAVSIDNPIIAEQNAITVIYERNNAQCSVRYWLDSSRMMRQVTQNAVTITEPLLENVEAFNVTYGVDYDASGKEDGSVDYWETSSASLGSRKVIAVRITLTARANSVNPDTNSLSPRTLTSTVTFRNLTYR